MCWSLQSNPGTENNISCHILFVGTARHPDRVACKPDRCAAPRYRAVFFCGLFSVTAGIVFKTQTLLNFSGAWWAIIYTGFISDRIGYTLQASSQ
jgi:hypothetical protein